MMIDEKKARPPYRLVESPDFGRSLREAAKVSVDERMLARNRAALLDRIAAEESKEGRGVDNPWSMQRRLAFAAMIVLLVSSAGGAAALYFDVIGNALFESDMDEDGSAAAFSDVSSPKKDDLLSSRVDAEPSAESRETTAYPEVEAPYDSEIRSSGKQLPGKGAPSGGVLEEQVRLFNKAKASLASGDPNEALEHLNRLKQRYPDSPLSLELKELYAHVLARLERYGEASRTIESLVRSRISTRKKAQLYRFLGDLQVKQNRCDMAQESYRRALGLGLSGEEFEAAKAGMRKCAP